MGNSHSKTLTVTGVLYKNLISGGEKESTALSNFIKDCEDKQGEVVINTECSTDKNLLIELSERFPKDIKTNKSDIYKLCELLKTIKHLISFPVFYKLMINKEYKFVEKVCKVLDLQEITDNYKEALQILCDIIERMLNPQSLANEHIITYYLNEFSKQLQEQKVGERAMNYFVEVLREFPSHTNDSAKLNIFNNTAKILFTILMRLTDSHTPDSSLFIDQLVSSIVKDKTFISLVLKVQKEKLFLNIVKLISRLKISSGVYNVTEIQIEALKNGIFLELLYNSIRNKPNDQIHDSQSQGFLILLQEFFYSNQEVLCIIGHILTPAHQYILQNGRPGKQFNTGSKVKSGNSYHWDQLIDLLSKSEDVEDIDIIFPISSRNYFLDKLSEEIDLIKKNIQERRSPIWRETEFHINFPAIDDVFVNGVYLDHYMTKCYQKDKYLENPDHFLSGLYELCMFDNDIDNKCLILKIISYIYDQYPQASVLPYHINYLKWLLSETSTDKFSNIQYAILCVFQVLFKNKMNIDLCIDSKCFDSLIHIYVQIIHIAYQKKCNAKNQDQGTENFYVSLHNRGASFVLSTLSPQHQDSEKSESTSQYSDDNIDAIVEESLSETPVESLSPLSDADEIHPEDPHYVYRISLIKTINNVNPIKLTEFNWGIDTSSKYDQFLSLIFDLLLQSIDYLDSLKLQFLQPEILSLFLQTFFFYINDEIDTKALSLIDHVIDLIPHHCYNLYKSGIFEVLLYYSLNRESQMPELVSNIFYRLHLIQSYDFFSSKSNVQNETDAHDEAKNHVSFEKIQQYYNSLKDNNGNKNDELVDFVVDCSCLNNFLPSPLIIKLVALDSVDFCNTFNSTQDITEFDLIWTLEMKNELREQLSRHIDPYKNAIQKDWYSLWIDNIKHVKFSYQYADSLIFCNYIYVNLYHGNANPLPLYVISGRFFGLLMELLPQYIEEIQNYSEGQHVKSLDLLYEEMNHITKSLYKLIRNSDYDIYVSEDHFNTLKSIALFDISEEGNYHSIYNAVTCITAAIPPINTYRNATNNREIFVKNGYIRFFNDFLTPIIHSQYLLQEEHVEMSDLYRALQLLIQALPQVTECQFVQEINADSIDILQHYCYFITSRLKDRFNNEFTSYILESIRNLLRDHKLIDCFVKSGCLLYIVDACITLFGNQDIDAKNQKLSEECLQYASGYETGYRELENTCDVLENLLTPGFVNHLRHHRFLDTLNAGDTTTPILIWNANMCTKLKETIQENQRLLLRDDNQQYLWDVDTFNKEYMYDIKYEDIMHKIMCHTVYLEEYIKNPEFMFEDPPVEDVLDDLLVDFQKIIDKYFEFPNASNETYIDGFKYFFTVYIQSLNIILDHYSTLDSTIYRSPSIKSIISLLKDTKIGQELAPGICTLISTLVPTKEGSNSLYPYISYFYILLNSKYFLLIKSILNILCTITTYCPEVGQIYMDTGLIVLFCKFIMESDVNNDDTSISDSASKILGICLENQNNKYEILKYCQSIFFPFFIDSNSYQSDLMGCKTNPNNLSVILHRDYDEPFLYWNDKTRLDLQEFIRSEIANLSVVYIEDTYKYDNTHIYEYDDVSKRYATYHKELNDQLYVSGVFLYAFNLHVAKVNVNVFIPDIIEYCNTLSIQNEYDLRIDVCKRHSGCIDAIMAYFANNEYDNSTSETYDKLITFVFKQLFYNIPDVTGVCLDLMDKIIQRENTIHVFENNIRRMNDEEMNNMDGKDQLDPPYYVLCWFKLIYQFNKDEQNLNRVLRNIQSLVKGSRYILVTFIEAGLISCLFRFINLKKHYGNNNSQSTALEMIQYCLTQSKDDAEIENLIGRYFVDEFKNHDTDAIYSFVKFMNQTHRDHKRPNDGLSLWNESVFFSIQKSYDHIWNQLPSYEFNSRVSKNLDFSIQDLIKIANKYDIEYRNSQPEPRDDSDSSDFEGEYIRRDEQQSISDVFSLQTLNHQTVENVYPVSPHSYKESTDPQYSVQERNPYQSGPNARYNHNNSTTYYSDEFSSSFNN